LPDDTTVVAGADSSAAELVVTGTARPQFGVYYPYQNLNYFQNVSYIKGGKNSYSWLSHVYNYALVPPYDNSVSSRSEIYSNIDGALNSSGSAYNSNVFNAASNVTGLLGLGGATILSSIDNLAGSNYPYDPVTLRNIETLGENLYKNVNIPLYQALYNGNDNFVLQTGQTLGSVAGGTEINLDYALVHNEQTYVQNFLNGLPSDQRASFIAESNAALQNPLTPDVIQNAISNLGHTFDFGNQADREAIGRAEVSHPSLYTQVRNVI